MITISWRSSLFSIQSNNCNQIMKWTRKSTIIQNDLMLISQYRTLIACQTYNLIMIGTQHTSKLFTKLLSRNLLSNTIRFAFTKDHRNVSNNHDKPVQKKVNVTFGLRHPLYSLVSKTLYERLKYTQYRRQHSEHKNNMSQNTSQKKSKQKTFQKQQNKSKKKNDQKQNKQFQVEMKFQVGDLMKKLAWVGLIVFLISQFMGESPNTNNNSDQKKNIEFLLKEIQSGPQPVIVTIFSKKIMTQIEVLCQIGTVKKYVTKMNENELVYFLQELQKIRGGSTTVLFTPTQFKINKYGHYIAQGMMIILFGSLIIFGYRFVKKMQQGAGSMDIGKIFNTKKFEPVQPENIKIFFKDVAGMHQAKFEITQFVDFLKKPHKYIEMGAKVPKGALLTGPPGTGKTLLAKACAGEAGVPFFSVSGSDFVQRYSGLGAARVRNLFDEAEKNAPSIIFIDQIDAIGKKRDAGPFSNQQRDNTLNQLLVRMDGFDTKNKVIVMAATNRKDMLDPALLRPGRFDRSVQIGLPSFEERAQILKVHLKKVKFDFDLTEDQLARKIARLTPGFSGAQLANTCNQAAILAARENLQTIPFSKFSKATERVIAGLERRNMFSPEQKQMLAFYEAGKAVANWFTDGADPVIKISILPFSKSKAGYSHSIKDETALHTKQQLLAKVCCYLSGRCAQQYFKGYVTTNGNNDLERAKKIITMIVTKFGMSESLKMFAFPDFDFIRKPYSQKTEALIDKQIAKITLECQKKVEEIIKQKQLEIMKVKQKLLEKQTLTHNQIKEILGERPYAANENYQEYLKNQEEQQSQRIPEGPRAGVASS